MNPGRSAPGLGLPVGLGHQMWPLGRESLVGFWRLSYPSVGGPGRGTLAVRGYLPWTSVVSGGGFESIPDRNGKSLRNLGLKLSIAWSSQVYSLSGATALGVLPFGDDYVNGISFFPSSRKSDCAVSNIQNPPSIGKCGFLPGRIVWCKHPAAVLQRTTRPSSTEAARCHDFFNAGVEKITWKCSWNPRPDCHCQLIWFM